MKKSWWKSIATPLTHYFVLMKGEVHLFPSKNCILFLFISVFPIFCQNSNLLVFFSDPPSCANFSIQIYSNEVGATKNFSFLDVKTILCKDAVSSWHLLLFSTEDETSTNSIWIYLFLVSTIIWFCHSSFWWASSHPNIHVEEPELKSCSDSAKKSARISLKVEKKVLRNVFPKATRVPTPLMNNSKRHSQIRFRCFFFTWMIQHTFRGGRGTRGLSTKDTLGQLRNHFSFLFLWTCQGKDEIVIAKWRYLKWLKSLPSNCQIQLFKSWQA